MLIRSYELWAQRSGNFFNFETAEDVTLESEIKDVVEQMTTSELKRISYDGMPIPNYDFDKDVFDYLLTVMTRATFSKLGALAALAASTDPLKLTKTVPAEQTTTTIADPYQDEHAVEHGNDVHSEDGYTDSHTRGGGTDTHTDAAASDLSVKNSDMTAARAATVEPTESTETTVGQRQRTDVVASRTDQDVVAGRRRVDQFGDVNTTISAGERQTTVYNSVTAEAETSEELTDAVKFEREVEVNKRIYDILVNAVHSAIIAAHRVTVR